MSLATYSDLTSAIADYMARGDLTVRIPDFITQAEGKFNRMIRTPDMEASVSLALTSSNAALPSDFLEWISATWVGATRSYDLRFAEPNSEEWRIRYRPNQDPTMFTIMKNVLYVKPGGASDNVTFYYYQKLPGLQANSTNWLMTKHPDIYMSMSLFEANVYVQNDDRASEFYQLAEDQMDKADLLSDAAKLGRRPNRDSETTERQQERDPTAGVI